MAITNVQLDAKASHSAEKSYNESDKTVQIKFSETWIVETDAPAHITAILSAGGLPAVGALYTFGGEVYRCMSVGPGNKTESPFAFEVRVDYQTPKKEKDGDNEDGDKWAVSIDIDGEKYQQPAHRALDADDNVVGVTNSAGQGFDNQPVETIYDERITIRYKTLDADSAQFAPLRGKCNDGPVTFTVKGMTRSFGPRHLLCDTARMSSSDALNDAPVWDVEIVLLARDDDEFTEHILDQGFCELDADGKLVPCTDERGDQYNAPCRLDGEGGRLPDDAEPDEAVFLDFKIIKEADLSGLFTGLS